MVKVERPNLTGNRNPDMLIEILIVWTVGIPLAVVAVALLGSRARAALSTTGRSDTRGQSNRTATVIQFQPIRLEPKTVGRHTAGPRVARRPGVKTAL
jgi:hypothetical protein